MSNIALIDGDEIAFKLAITYQQKYYTILKDDKVLWRCKYKEEAIESIGNRDDLEIGEEIEVYECTDYKRKLDEIISSICNNTNSSSWNCYLSGNNNFRKSIATLLPYKGNRSTEKPFHYSTITSELRERGAISVDYLEADDLMSIEYHLKDNGVICSTDKDLRTVPSLNYNIDKKELKRITNEEADKNFFLQLLIGDSVDNIPSPYGLGKAKAESFLETIHPNYYENYYQTFIPFYNSFLTSKFKSGDKKGSFRTSWYSSQKVEDILLEVGNLLWMKREYSMDEKWSPNG